MDDGFVVLRAELHEDSEVMIWTEVSRCPTEPEALKLAASLRTNSVLFRVLAADDVEAVLSPPPDIEAFELRVVTL